MTVPPPVEIVIATGNAGKAREFRDLLGAGRAWLSLADFPGVAEVPETGHTFRANACLKAAGYALATGRWALADDSGLAVDALGGKPGVYSARWAAMHDAGTGDAANNALLLSQLADVPDERRAARFVCVLALADPTGRVVLTASDTMDGRLLRSPRGANGFGYDPIFVPTGHDVTSAELTADDKHRISHRGRALRQLRTMLIDVGLASPAARMLS